MYVCMYVCRLDSVSAVMWRGWFIMFVLFLGVVLWDKNNIR
jgi:hypothetical protein